MIRYENTYLHNNIISFLLIKVFSFDFSNNLFAMETFPCSLRQLLWGWSQDFPNRTVNAPPAERWYQEAPWKGTLTLEKLQKGHYNLFKIKIQLLFPSFFLFANILAYGFFIQTYCARAVSSRPEMLTLHLFAL